jgi:UDP-glucose 4-epimerase
MRRHQVTDPGRILGITGPFGYIGTQVIKRLVRADGFERIICLDIKHPKEALPERLEFHRCDVREGEKLRSIFERAGVNTVLHLAYIVNPTRDSEVEYGIDIHGSHNVLAAAEAAGVRRLVVASSDTVYGFFEGTADQLIEDAPLRATPGFSYAENKVEMEGLVADFARRVRGCEVVVLRPCIVMGPGMDNATGQALRQPLIFSVWGYDPIMQFIHEEDIGEAFYLALTSQARGAFNVAADEGVRLSEVARIMGRFLVPVPACLAYPLVEILYRLRLIPFGSSQLDYIRYPLSMNTDKIRRELGFSPRYSSRQTLEVFRDAKPL